jgi:hypothetical protein
MSPRASRSLMLVLAVACAAQAGNSADPAVEPGWDQSFKAGATDQNGHYMGGGTIMHLVGHKGHLFAADSYWCDSRNMWYGGANPNTGWAQILRLDHPGGPWVVATPSARDPQVGHLSDRRHRQTPAKPGEPPPRERLLAIAQLRRCLPVYSQRCHGKMDEKRDLLWSEAEGLG